jgi:hypothetical protein
MSVCACCGQVFFWVVGGWGGGGGLQGGRSRAGGRAGGQQPHVRLVCYVHQNCVHQTILESMAQAGLPPPDTLLLHPRDCARLPALARSRLQRSRKAGTGRVHAAQGGMPCCPAPSTLSSLRGHRIR